MQTNSSSEPPKDNWASGEAYEPYVGRWSRLVAEKFLGWLAVPIDRIWLDVGCGTAALTGAVLQFAAPIEVKGIDAAESYIHFARNFISDERASFHVGDAHSLPVSAASCDAAVSGLVLNFLQEPLKAVEEMARTTRAGGIVAVYVWDYAGRMQFMRHFWNAAAALDPAAVDLDEGRRFPLCQPAPLTDLFKRAGLSEVETRPLDIWTTFKDFDDYWTPFLGGQGPAPGYLKSLTQEKRLALRERLRSALPFALDGSIPLMARAWAVRGVR